MAWYTLPPTCPMMVSAEAPLFVGIALKTSTRSFPPSAMNSRLSAARAKRGKFRVELHAAG